MRGGNRVPTPWRHRWRRFRYSALPAISFLVCIALTLWMWNRQGRMPNAVGEVYAEVYFVKAVADGLLLPLSERGDAAGAWWEIGAPVRKEKTVVARLDNEVLDGQLSVLSQDLIRLHKQLIATEEEVLLEQAGREFDHECEARRQRLAIDRLRLEKLQYESDVKIDEAEQRRLEAQLSMYESAPEGLVTKMQMQSLRLQLATVKQRIAENTKLLSETVDQLAEAEARSIDPPAVAQPDKRLDVVRAEIKTQEARIQDLKTQIKKLEILAPITGVISAIHCVPGQHVQAGDPIVEIAAENGAYVLTYVRQEQRFRPAVGMPVDLRIRAPGSPPVAAEIKQVGPRMEPVPTHHLRDPRLQEWGRPVLIGLPPEFKFKLPPGELIDLTFRF